MQALLYSLLKETTTDKKDIFTKAINHIFIKKI